MASPATPSLEHVFTIRADIGPAKSGGVGAHGERLHIPILGGDVSGPRLAGRILPGGSDWPLLRRDGASEISAIYTIEASDGTLILVRNNGLRISSPLVLQRLRAGEAVDPSEYYFRSSPVFEAPDGSHKWLSEGVFVASLAPRGHSIEIAVYLVT